MKEAPLRSPLVRRAIEAINQGNLNDFMALFARDATVVDVSPYRGHEAIRAWAQRETFNVQVRFQVVREKNIFRWAADLVTKSWPVSLSVGREASATLGILAVQGSPRWQDVAQLLRVYLGGRPSSQGCPDPAEPARDRETSSRPWSAAHTCEPRRARPRVRRQ